MSTTIIRQRRQKTSKEERMCSICFQTFKKVEHLDRHFRSHTKEKPYRCDVCGRHYTRHDTLLRHSRSHGQNLSRPKVTVQDASEAISLPMEISNIFPHTPDTSIAVDSNIISRPLETPTSALFSTESQEFSINQAAGLPPSVWPSGNDTGWASWLADEDFDLEAINLSLLQASDNTVQTVNDVMDQTFADFAVDHHEESQPDPQPSIQRTWHTYTVLETSGDNTPPSSQKKLPINDAYRKRLAENLRQNVQHGIVPSTSFLWARMAKMFQEETLEEENNLIDVDGGDLQAAWKAWISAEERKRLVLSINLLDAELAKLRHHEPVLRPFVNELPQAASSKLFAASTAEQWKSSMLESQITKLASANTTAKGLHVSQDRVRHAEEITDFERSVSLDSIAALAYERRGSTNAERCRRLLVSWYEQHQGHLRENEHSRASLLMLWHSVFLVIHADLDALERACGRDGEDVSWKATRYAQEWANSADAVRCILHAMQIQALFEAIPVGTEPSIHVPMCLYHCGLVWFCFSRFFQRGQARRLGDNFQFPEMALAGIDRSDGDVRNMLSEYSGGLQAGQAGLNKVFVMIDLLQRIVHWKIAQSFATTLLTLVESEQDIF
ncbi:Zinc finger protein 281 [Talaromyces islandicus]|uniref:Zinc finger protein 281 n=1 Tax=Talaromyces islandicus TaxID=28573 RepID=A0A0U1LN06_TALIS|nr:Zinc finger protein 281 [Talaromyces islandicus]